MNRSKLNSILQAFSVQRYSLSVHALFSHVLAFCSLHYSVAVFLFRVAVLCVPSFLFPTARFLDHRFAQFSTVGQMKMVFYQKIVIFRNTNFLRIKYIYTQIYFNWKQVHCSFFFFYLGNLKGSLWASERMMDDIMIRKFVEGVMHEYLVSEVVIKRKANRINIVFLVPPVMNLPKFYFLVGFTETLLTEMLECIVKVECQSTM